MRNVTLTVNGQKMAAKVEPRTHLADFLRDHLRLTGTHIGCEHGICGACTVAINGEIGRACIAHKHRGLKVLYLLWCGLGIYLDWNKKRYLFGCNSLTSQNPTEGKLVMDYLVAKGHMHSALKVYPQPGFVCFSDDLATPQNARAKVPRLMRVYLSFGAKICGPPALDRLFKTIDYFAFFDAETLDQRTLAYFQYCPASTP